MPLDRERLSKCLLAVAELHGRTITPAVASLWFDALKAHDSAAVEDAFRRHVSSPDGGQFMPKPADIVKLLAGSSQDGSMIAWAKLDRAVRSVGPYQSVVFDDPIVHKVVADMGGWLQITGKTEDEWPFVGNEFRTRYMGYRTRGTVGEYPRTLIGLVEADNNRRGYPSPKPVLIGDPGAAMAVLKGGSESSGPRITHVVDALRLPSKQPGREAIATEAT